MRSNDFPYQRVESGEDCPERVPMPDAAGYSIFTKAVPPDGVSDSICGGPDAGGLYLGLAGPLTTTRHPRGNPLLLDSKFDPDFPAFVHPRGSLLARSA